MRGVAQVSLKLSLPHRHRPRILEGFGSTADRRGSRVIKVVFDVAQEGYVDVEREFAAAMARD